MIVQSEDNHHTHHLLSLRIIGLPNIEYDYLKTVFASEKLFDVYSMKISFSLLKPRCIYGGKMN